MRRLIALLLTLVIIEPAHAQNRHALVVGIDAYAHVEPLQKAVNDAKAMAAALEQVGFSVDLQINSAETELLTAISDLASRAGRGDEVVVFFAGHGIEVDGQNYLLPADVPALAPGQELIMRRRSVPLSDITDALTAREVRVSLLILDACRNNPFPRQGTRSLGGSRGLARVAPPQGSYVIYSAGAGQEALDRLSNDDRNPNSVFTRAFLPRITQPGLDLREIVQEVRSDVRRVAMSVGHDQFPAVYDQLDGSFMFDASVPSVAHPIENIVSGPISAATTPVTSGMTPTEINERGIDYELGRGVEIDLVKAYQYYLAAAETGYAEAMNNLGYLYGGSGIIVSDTSAANWFQRAAELNHPEALYNLGLHYYLGRGRMRNNQQAAYYFLASEKAGDTFFRSQIGVYFTQGEGVLREAQKYLAFHNLYNGPIDGIFGPQSMRALNLYVNIVMPVLEAPVIVEPVIVEPVIEPMDD